MLVSGGTYCSTLLNARVKGGSNIAYRPQETRIDIMDFPKSRYPDCVPSISGHPWSSIDKQSDPESELRAQEQEQLQFLNKLRQMGNDIIPLGKSSTEAAEDDEPDDDEYDDDDNDDDDEDSEMVEELETPLEHGF